MQIADEVPQPIRWARMIPILACAGALAGVLIASGSNVLFLAVLALMAFSVFVAPILLVRSLLRTAIAHRGTPAEGQALQRIDRLALLGRSLFWIYVAGAVVLGLALVALSGF